MSTDPRVHESTAASSMAPQAIVAPGSSGSSSAPSSDARARSRKRRVLILFLVVLVLAILTALVVMPRLGPQADPAKVAVAYVWADEHRDYGAQWDLAGPEVRRGLDRSRFVAIEKQAEAAAERSPSRVQEIVADRVEVQGTRAVVLIRRELPDRTLFREIVLARNGGRWEVVAERLL